MYNLNSVDGEKHLILNLPKALNIKDLFPTFTTKQLFATEFIVNQINHFSYYKKKQGYSFNVVTHASFLGVSRNIIYQITSTLVKNNIIVMDKNYIVGERSKCYKMVSPYSDENSNQIFFKRSNPKNYKFINQFIDNGYRITPNDEEIIQKNELIKEEKNEIETLKSEIKELRDALNKALKSNENELKIKPYKNTLHIVKEVDEKEIISEPMQQYEVHEQYKEQFEELLSDEQKEYVFNNISEENPKITIDNKYIIYLSGGMLKVA